MLKIVDRQMDQAGGRGGVVMFKTVDRQVEEGMWPCLRQWTGRQKRGCGHAEDSGQAD